MTIHTTKKSTSLHSSRKQCPTHPVQTKSATERQCHKINPLYETPFLDVVTNEYVRGYN